MFGVYLTTNKGLLLNPDRSINSFNKSSLKYLFLNVFVGTLLLLFLNGVVLVDVGEAGVVFNRFSGMTNKKIIEGFNWINPITEKVKVFDVKLTKCEYSKLSGLSSDSQTIFLDIVVNYKLDNMKLREIYQTVYGNIVDTILYNAVIDTSKAELGKFRIDDIARNRENLKSAIQETLKIRMKEKYVDIINVSITNVDYSDTYEKAIEAKLVAEQEALEAKNQKEKTRYLAEAKAIENQNLSRTITPLVLKQKWIEKWNGQLPNVITEGSDLLMNISSTEK